MKRLILASVAALSLGLVGCEENEALGSNGAPICLDTAIPFDYSMESFVVSENLEESGSWDYLYAIEPADPSTLTGDQTAVFDYIRNKTNTKFAATGTPTEVDGITSFNNSLDTMESVIANEEVGNLNSARDQMLQAMELNVTCSYNNTAAYLSDISDNKKYYIVRYNHITESTQGSAENAVIIPQRVDKILVEYERTEIINEDGEPKIKGTVTAISQSALSPSTFSATGYNLPLATVIKFIDSDATLNFTKDYQEQVDTLEVITNDSSTLGSLTDIKRVKLSIDYRSLDATIFTSKFITAYECENGDKIYDPVISVSNDVIEEDNLELTIPSTESSSGNLDDTCKNPIRYFDPNYDYNPVTEKKPDSLMPVYTGSTVISRQ